MLDSACNLPPVEQAYAAIYADNAIQPITLYAVRFNETPIPEAPHASALPKGSFGWFVIVPSSFCPQIVGPVPKLSVLPEGTHGSVNITA